MRRRLIVAILTAVAATLVLAGLGTLVLARLGSARIAEENLRSEVETAAALVKLGQSRGGGLDTEQLDELRRIVCARGSAATERDRALFCQGGRPPLGQATRQLCTRVGYLQQLAVPTPMDASRQALCAAPTAETLTEVRRTWCESTSPEVTAGRGPRMSQQIAFAVRAFCASIGSPQPRIEAALADDSIDLIEVDDQGAVVSGALPAGLAAADLRVDSLRLGETVSGSLGGGSFAATAVDPTAAPFQLVVAGRPDDPTAGLVPWFLLASGATLLLGTAVALWVSRSLVGPLREATAVTAQIAAGDLDARLPAAGPEPPGDEVGQLSRSINTMAGALQESREAERQFILSVSHELRTPLTSIRGYAEAIADGASDPDRAAQIIVAESRRLERLVADLLQLGVLDAHQFTFHPVTADLNEIAADAVDAVRRDVENAGLALTFAPAPGPVPVHLDPDRVGQVMANLVENAIKFAATRVGVSVAHDGDQDPRSGHAGRARLEVVDDGPGIPTEDLPHVFERRFKASTAPVRRQVGTGLGLAIAREMVQAMGGTIALANDAGGGARVTIELTVVAPD